MTNKARATVIRAPYLDALDKLTAASWRASG